MVNGTGGRAAAGLFSKNIFMEEWADIPGFEFRYQINKNGDVKNKANGGSILKGWIGDDGYQKVCLRKPGEKSLYFRVHRMVALLFVPNPENKPLINHIDSNKLNNSVINLEWCTSRENIIHAFKNNRMRKDGRIMQLRPASKRHRKGTKVTEADREIIKKLSEKGLLLREIKKTYNLSLGYISMIIHDSD